MASVTEYHRAARSGPSPSLTTSRLMPVPEICCIAFSDTLQSSPIGMSERRAAAALQELVGGLELVPDVVPIQRPRVALT